MFADRAPFRKPLLNAVTPPVGRTLRMALIRVCPADVSPSSTDRHRLHREAAISLFGLTARGSTLIVREARPRRAEALVLVLRLIGEKPLPTVRAGGEVSWIAFCQSGRNSKSRKASAG